MNVAVFGGRFDPPHVGHLAVAREILKSKPEINEIWFMPANTHPWRQIIAPPLNRLQMLKLMEEDKIKAKDLDIYRGGETYTIDTVKLLFQENRNNKYFWVCGIDQLKDLYRWKEYEALEKLIDFLVFPRKGFNEKTNLPKNVSLIKGDFIATDLSSSAVRNRIKNGQSIAGLVTPKVEQYIHEKKLYV